MATDITTIWDRYERSKTYMAQKSILRKTEKNWLMYIGEQWQACENSEGKEDLPMLNFIKPTVKYKTSSIASTKVTAIFSDLNNAENEVQMKDNDGRPMYDAAGQPIMDRPVVSRCNDLFSISWEKSKMQKFSKRGLRNAAVAGDSYAYWGEGGDTRKSPQILHNTQMHLGDENTTDFQRQPWIIIEERLDAKAVREIAKNNGIPAEDIEMIRPDSATENEILNKDEVKGKVTSLIYMEKDKKTGIVSVAKCVKNVMYEKLHAIQPKRAATGEPAGAGLKLYPIVPLIWEEQPNNARGVSEVEMLIPNQLELNKTLARRIISSKMTGYPRLAYDDTAIANPEALDKVGAAIKMNGGDARAIGNMIAYLAPQAISGDAKELCDELLNLSRTLAGASDAQLGNIDLSRVSGTAAQTIRDQQQLPLNEQQEMFQDFIENVALLWFELWKVYYPEGVEMDGIKVRPEEIAAITPNVRVDIAEDTSLSKMAMQSELTNLFNNNKITFAEFAEAYPEHSSLPKDVLQKIASTRLQMQQQGIPLINDDGTPINDMLGGGVKPGGLSGGSYQGLQASLAR